MHSFPDSLPPEHQWSALPGGSFFPVWGFYQLLFRLCFVCFLFPHTHTQICKTLLYFILFKKNAHKEVLCLPSWAWLVSQQTGPFTTFGWYMRQEASENVAVLLHGVTKNTLVPVLSVSYSMLHAPHRSGGLNVPVEKWLTPAWKRCTASFPYRLCAASI